jgi:hypothetical protein
LGVHQWLIGLAVYREADFPFYRTGLWVTLALNIGSIFVLAILSLTFKRQNKKAERGEVIIENAQGFLYTL